MNSLNSNLYKSCALCPRKCGINRENNLTGFCKESAELRISTACLHFGEEPPITGEKGSGTIFITGCNLRCAFCQNYQISQCGMGRPVSKETFAEICLKLQEEGAENINIVTGSHAVPSIVEGLLFAKAEGLTIPVCWNSSGYETEESIQILSSVVDIWLPDLKTLNPLISEAIFQAKDYPSVAKKAIRAMIEKSPLVFDENEKMISGVIIRHLVLPGRMDDTILVLDWLKKHCDGKSCLSLMSQYTPVNFSDDKTPSSLEHRKKALEAFPNRFLSTEEFAQIHELITDYKFEYLFYQDLDSDNCKELNADWLPDFKKNQPFSNALAKPVWHWNFGFTN